MHSRSSAVLGTLFALTACRGGGSGGTESTTTTSGGGGFSNATSLTCPSPGTLPFALPSSGFQNADNDPGPRDKSESADFLGTPMGVHLTTYANASDKPTAEALPFRGRMASGQIKGGLVATPLTGENVSLFSFDGAKNEWLSLGRGTTGDTGHYELPYPSGFTPTLGQPIYAVLEANGHCSEHYDFAMPMGARFVVTDVDGTMTLSDEELFKQIDDGNYDPKENQSASALMNRWSKKGYPVVYLTARPHVFRAETRHWLNEHGFPAGPIISANSLVFDQSARDYKSAWVKRMQSDYGWQIVAAYGNAESDVQAYEDAGIAKKLTFIVGPLAGASSTQPIKDNDFTSHITEFVDVQPDNK